MRSNRGIWLVLAVIGLIPVVLWAAYFAREGFDLPPWFFVVVNLVLGLSFALPLYFVLRKEPAEG